MIKMIAKEARELQNALAVIKATSVMIGVDD